MRLHPLALIDAYGDRLGFHVFHGHGARGELDLWRVVNETDLDEKDLERLPVRYGWALWVPGTDRDKELGLDEVLIFCAGRHYRSFPVTVLGDEAVDYSGGEYLEEEIPPGRSYANAAHRLVCVHAIGTARRYYSQRCHVIKRMPAGRLKVLTFRNEGDSRGRIRYVPAWKVSLAGSEAKR